MRMTVRGLIVAGVVAGGATLLAPPAGAHITPDKDEVPADSFNSVTLTVPHGCEESPTRAIAVEVPEGINSITPQVNSGWDIEVATEELPEPIDDGEGGELTERDSVVTFTAQPGNELPVNYRTQFTLGFRTPDTPGEYLFFKTVQTCVEGETAWIEEYTGEGEEPEHPSPVLLVSEAEPEGGEDAATEDDVAASEDEAAAGDAAGDTAEDDSDSSTGLAAAGLVVGLLGLAAGGFALFRTRSSSSSA
ncbi:MAG: YcnI family protein [Acidimicrobiales bacterium]